MWQNIWFEENWKENNLRPILVLNKVWNIFTWISMTTKWKDNNKFYHKIISIDFGKLSYCILSQIKSYDKKRFVQYLWKLSKDEFIEIKKSLKEMHLPGI